MAGQFWKWSTTAASNATADNTVGWSEGQSPSSVNDSARAMMASVASYRIDRSGSNVVGGTATAYTLTTSQAFAALADMDGQEISFTITPTNGDAATLNVNGLGAKALVFAVGGAMPAGSLIDGSIYTATYVNAANCWKVRSVIGNPYNIPIAGGMDYWGTTVPNANFAFPIGQAISRTTYAALFTIMGTTYGVGDGSTTFNLPDKRERVSAMKTSAANRLTSTYFGGNSANMGAVGGLESNNVILTHTHTADAVANHEHFVAAPGSAAGGSVTASNSVAQLFNTSGSTDYSLQSRSTDGASIGRSSSAGGHTPVIQNAGSASAHNIVQPTIICNYIIRII